MHFCYCWTSHVKKKILFWNQYWNQGFEIGIVWKHLEWYPTLIPVLAQSEKTHFGRVSVDMWNDLIESCLAAGFAPLVSVFKNSLKPPQIPVCSSQYFLQVPLNHWCCLPHHGASQPIGHSRESCSPGSRLPITQHLSSITSWSSAWASVGRSWTTASLLGRQSCWLEIWSR